MMFSPKKALYFVFVFFALSLSRSDDQKSYPRPPSCARFECPSYDVVHTQSEFEIRRYNTTLWVSGPPIPSKYYRPAANAGFWILFSYYNGNNTEKVKINMTAPVLVDPRNSTYTVHFYVPQKYQSDGGKTLPKPLTSAITKVKLPNYKYAAIRRFSGFINDDVIPTQVNDLKKSLNGTCYERASTLDEFTIAGYNNPFELKNRINEIMFFFD